MQAEAPAGGRPRTHHFIGRNFAPMNLIGERGQIDERGISERTRAVFGCFELPFDAEPSWYSRADRLLGAFWVQFSWPFFLSHPGAVIKDGVEQLASYQSLRKFVPSAPRPPSPAPPPGTEETVGERRRSAMVRRFAVVGHPSPRPSPRSCLTGRGSRTRSSLRRLRHTLAQRLIWKCQPTEERWCSGFALRISTPGSVRHGFAVFADGLAGRVRAFVLPALRAGQAAFLVCSFSITPRSPSTMLGLVFVPLTATSGTMRT